MLEVISSERKDNKKGKWLVIVCKNEKGQDRTYNIFDNDDAGKKIINESFKGPGKYDEKTVKNGQYWNLVELNLLGLAQPATAAATAQPPATHQGAPAAAVVSSKPVTRAEIAQVCVAAVARIYEGKGSVDSALNDNAALLARVFMNECATFINAGKTSTGAAPEGA